MQSGLSAKDRYSWVAIVGAMTCFSLAWLWPIRSSVWNDFNQEALAFYGLIALFFLSSPSIVRLTYSTVAILGIALLPLLQIVFGIISFSGDGWLSLFYLMAFFTSVCVGFNLSVNDEGRRLVVAFCTAAAIVSVLSALIAIRQWLGVADSIWEIHHEGARSYGNLAQPNHLATLICFGLISLIYFYERRLLSAGLLSAIAIFLLFCLAITQSRTPWVFSLLLLVLWVWFGRRCEQRLSSRLLLVWILVFVALTLLVPILADIAKLQSQTLADRLGASSRLKLWAGALHLITERPVFGFGWGQIAVAQVEFSESYPIQGNILTYSHNLFLDLLLWNGIWIGGGIIAFILAWQVWLLRSVKKLESYIALLLVAMFFTHAMFEYPHAYAYFLIPAGLMLGVAEGSRRPSVSLSFPLWARIGLAVISIGVMVQVVREYQYFEQNEFNRRMTAAKVTGFNQIELKGGVLLLTQLDALQWFQRQDPIAQSSPAQLNRMAEVVSRYPYLTNIYRYALVLAKNGLLEKARKQLAVLKMIHGDDFYELALQQIGSALGPDVQGHLRKSTEH